MPDTRDSGRGQRVLDDWMKKLAGAKTANALKQKPASAADITAANVVSATHADFLRQYGEIRAFPDGRAYRLHVHALRPPVERDGCELLELGNDDGLPVYFTMNDAGKVYAIFDGELDEVAGSFDEWLEGAFQHIHDSYSDEEWQELLDGAPPFSTEERAIVDARKRFDVELEGVTPDKKLRLRVHNGSARTLPWLTVGVRSRDPLFEGALWLDVSKLGPGATETFTVDAYRDLTEPENLELISLPDPTPGDRSSFRELERT
jgi:hypothetical protein